LICARTLQYDSFISGQQLEKLVSVYVRDCFDNVRCFVTGRLQTKAFGIFDGPAHRFICDCLIVGAAFKEINRVPTSGAISRALPGNSKYLYANISKTLKHATKSKLNNCHGDFQSSRLTSEQKNFSSKFTIHNAYMCG